MHIGHRTGDQKPSINDRECDFASRHWPNSEFAMAMAMVCQRAVGKHCTMTTDDEAGHVPRLPPVGGRGESSSSSRARSQPKVPSPLSQQILVTPAQFTIQNSAASLHFSLSSLLSPSLEAFPKIRNKRSKQQPSKWSKQVRDPAMLDYLEEGLEPPYNAATTPGERV